MTSSFNGPSAGLFSRRPSAVQWLSLLIVSALLITVLEWLQIPAALLLAPMISGILLGVNGASIRIPSRLSRCGQAFIGCMIARSITPDIIDTCRQEWPLFLGAILAAITASSVLGWLLSRWHILPGTTAVWGTSPGAATAMTIMAEAFGADVRLVAFMQYLRVVFVALAASLIARFWVPAGTAAVAAQATVWFPPIAIEPFALTILLAMGGMILGHLFRLPAGHLLGPLLIGAYLHATGLLDIVLPEWLLAACYALLGWYIGLAFTRDILVHAARALPQLIASIFVLIALCGAIAYILTWAVGVDPLTAYLATSPGGMDSVAIIAASTKSVDLSFVMALQTVRFLVVVAISPPLARFIARHCGGQTPRG